MPHFKKTNIKAFSKTSKQETPETIFWKQFRDPILIKEFGSVDYINFSPIEPHYFAVTSSVNVQIYNPITKQALKNFNRFREKAYGGNFRSDGMLLCAGCEEAQIKLFDVTTRSTLRVFSGHKAPVHRCFFTQDKTHIVSFSDDKTVALWDIPSEKQIVSFEEHSDYVRAGSVSPVSTDIFISGGYDGCVKMFDSRMNSAAFSVDHGSPIESVVFLPTGGIFCTAGGIEIKVWDAFSGGKLLAKLINHHKTVTCLTVTRDGKNLFSGGLDRQAKIYEISNFEVVHTVNYPSNLLSLDVSPNNETLVAGMVDGLVSVIRREQPTTKEIRKEKQFRTRAKFAPDEFVTQIADIHVLEQKPAQFQKFDNHLKHFQYSKALGSVLMPYVLNKYPEYTVSVFQELIRRDGLKRAFAGRDEKSLILFLRFLNKNISVSSFSRILLAVAHQFLDLYEDSKDLSPEVCKLIELIYIKVQEEEKLTEQFLLLRGAIDLLLASEIKNAESPTNKTLTPSENAQNNNLVVNLI